MSGLGEPLLSITRFVLQMVTKCLTIGQGKGSRSASMSGLLQSAPPPPAAQTHIIFTRDSPPHDPHSLPSCQIEKVVETHILQIKEAVVLSEDKEKISHDIFEVFTTEKKKHKNKSNKISKLATTLPK